MVKHVAMTGLNKNLRLQASDIRQLPRPARVCLYHARGSSKHECRSRSGCYVGILRMQELCDVSARFLEQVMHSQKVAIDRLHFRKNMWRKSRSAKVRVRAGSINRQANS